MTFAEMTQAQRISLYRLMQAFIKSAAKIEASNAVIPVTVPVLVGSAWLTGEEVLARILELTGGGAAPANMVVHNGDPVTSGE